MTAHLVAGGINAVAMVFCSFVAARGFWMATDIRALPHERHELRRGAWIGVVMALLNLGCLAFNLTAVAQ